MIISMYNDDITTSEVEAIVNPVNCVGVMGKGIALQIKQRYPITFEQYKKACWKRQVKTGEMFVHKTKTDESPNYIINFPTKQHWKNSSKIEYIKQGLKDLVKVIKREEIRTVAIPALGCGNGGLKWSVVKPLIVKAMEGLDVDVLLYEPLKEH